MQHIAFAPDDCMLLSKCSNPLLGSFIKDLLYKFYLKKLGSRVYSILG